MPELPEVECLTRAVAKSLAGATLQQAVFHRPDLRDPIPIKEFKRALEGRPVERFWRRSKYMIWQSGDTCAVFHLGMTGNMRMFDDSTPQFAHTHAVFKFETAQGKDQYLHFIDPRRFGRITYCQTDTLYEHPFFKSLGPEPLATRNLGDYLFERSRGRKQGIKTFLMDAKMVVGVGNIYASESLFRAGIHPARAAGSVARKRYQILGRHIQATLREAIKAGGTTFRDFKSSDGEPGYFSVKLNVYDRTGQPCNTCSAPILTIKQTGRSTFFCKSCQT